MKLRVQRDDGSIETISVVGPVEIEEGRTLAHIHSAEGLDHYFTLDGCYDGWGMAIPEGTPGTELIERIEKDRDIEPPKE